MVSRGRRICLGLRQYALHRTCPWQIPIISGDRLHFINLPRSAIALRSVLMRDLTVLLLHLLTTLARLLGPSGMRAMVAETLLIKHQLLILNRSWRRAVGFVRLTALTGQRSNASRLTWTPTQGRLPQCPPTCINDLKHAFAKQLQIGLAVAFLGSRPSLACWLHRGRFYARRFAIGHHPLIAKRRNEMPERVRYLANASKHSVACRWPVVPPGCVKSHF